MKNPQRISLGTVVSSLAKEQQLESRTSSEALQKVKPSYATKQEIMAVIWEVETLKELNPPLTEEQRGLLMARLFELRLPLEEIRRKGDSVVYKKTYGTIALEHWVEDEVDLRCNIEAEIIRLREGFDRRVDERIREMIEECRQEESYEKSLEAEEATKLEALQDALSEARLDRMKYYEKMKAESKKRLAQIRSSLVAMDNEHRAKVWEEAVRRGIVKTWDAHMVDHIWMFVDILYPIMNEVK